jgi:hypothetical protein
MSARLIAVAESGSWTTFVSESPRTVEKVEVVKEDVPARVGIDALVEELTAIVVRIPNLPREDQNRMLSFLGSAYSLVHAKVTLGPGDQTTFESSLRSAIARQRGDLNA